jgi:vacuolar-type H+-ATPase subunit E/Vma4
MNEKTDPLAEQILEDARKQAEPIARKAKRRAEDAVRRAEQEADQRYKEILDQARERIRVEEQRLRARTELDVENIRRSAREEIFRQVRLRAMDKLGELTASADYPEVLARLALRGLAAMSGRHFEVVLRPADRDALGERTAQTLRDRAATQLGRRVVVKLAEDTLTAAGGLVVRRTDGKQVCDQTFEALMERLWDTLRQEIAADLALKGPAQTQTAPVDPARTETK